MTVPNAGLGGAEFGAHRPALLRFATTLVGIPDAEDLVQDALAQAWRKRTAYRPERGPLLPWLLALVADQARDRWRRRKDPLVLTVTDYPAPSRDGEQRLDVRDAIARLAPRQRTAVILFYYVDLTVEDAATVMRCSVGTVKSTLHDARRALATQLGGAHV